MAEDLGYRDRPGIQPRLLKAAGMCDEARGIDILDRQKEFTDDKIPEYLGQLHDVYLSQNREALQKIAGIIDEQGSLLGTHYPFPAVATMFDLNRPFSLDNYVVGDFMTWDPGSTKFDLVTGICCIAALPVRGLLKKVHSLLTGQGLLGGNFLGKFRVDIDYTKNQLILERKVDTGE